MWRKNKIVEVEGTVVGSYLIEKGTGNVISKAFWAEEKNPRIRAIDPWKHWLRPGHRGHKRWSKASRSGEIYAGPFAKGESHLIKQMLREGLDIMVIDGKRYLVWK